MVLEVSATNERRKFGRRTSRIHAWVLLDTGQRIACTITDHTAGGARLVVSAGSNLPGEFNLNVDGLKGSIRCSVRHETAGVAGIAFLRDTPAMKAAIDEFLGWMAR